MNQTIPDGEKREVLKRIATLIRYYILASTTKAGSGHPTSSLSATDLMTGLLFGGAFRFDLDNPCYPNNDRLIFSKGHASPLFYALWAAAGKVTEDEIMTLREFGSQLEGHPVTCFPYTEAATGSLGQGLSIGIGMALNAKYLDRLPYRTYVLLGDGEMTEGSQWEAIQIAAHYKLNNLIGIVDVNRLGQCGETMYGHDLAAYEKRIGAFGWHTIVIDGHSFDEITAAYESAAASLDRPVMVIARTIKGKGVSFIEDKNGWHGKALKKEEFDMAMAELGPVDRSIRGKVLMPENLEPEEPVSRQARDMEYKPDAPVATRRAYGNALARIFPKYPDMVVLDGEVGNSTYAEIFKAAYPDRFFEMYIGEQNMVDVALGLAQRGKHPFVSTFAAFFTRAFDQIRMSQYSLPDLVFAGSHAGVSIGQDGPSQMGLEDIAMFRTLLGDVVLYPSDAISAERLVEAAAGIEGIVYIRTTRKETPILYDKNEPFTVGGSKILRKSTDDIVTIVAAGITVHEALAAWEMLKKDGISVRVIDLYSIKPIDTSTLLEAATETKIILTVEDHFAEGGLGEAVQSALAQQRVPIHVLAVRTMPRSGKPDELLDYEEISRNAIIRKVKELL
ncbi:MAG: Transketolase 2 [Syntrophorhabdus sp. PtaU1.Bin153]|nr:MAG: Transketolase 2 [Syntrophorhabdus sp. PtaU1.Bin153]